MNIKTTTTKPQPQAQAQTQPHGRLAIKNSELVTALSSHIIQTRNNQICESNGKEGTRTHKPEIRALGKWRGAWMKSIAEGVLTTGTLVGDQK